MFLKSNVSLVKKQKPATEHLSKKYILLLVLQVQKYVSSFHPKLNSFCLGNKLGKSEKLPNHEAGQAKIECGHSQQTISNQIMRLWKYLGQLRAYKCQLWWISLPAGNIPVSRSFNARSWLTLISSTNFLPHEWVPHVYFCIHLQVSIHLYPNALACFSPSVSQTLLQTFKTPTLLWENNLILGQPRGKAERVNH